MLIDTSHVLDDGYSKVITVDKQADSVDYALVRLLNSGDIAVTQDYGLAAMALSRGARPINHNGMVYSDENIDKLLMDRYVGQKVRRGGGRTKGPAKRGKEDDARFAAALAALITDT